MSLETVQLQLHTQLATTIFWPPDLQTAWEIPYEQPAELEVIEGFTLPDGEYVHNPFHLDMPNVATLSGVSGEDSVSLEAEKAKRLVQIFRSLRANHSLDCHDLLTEIEEWDTDRGGPDCADTFLSPNEPATSGMPYAVIAHLFAKKSWGRKSEEWRRTHSCLGTSAGKFMGLISRGNPLVIVDHETTLAVYGHRALGQIHEAVSPDIAIQFKNRVVPT